MISHIMLLGNTYRGPNGTQQAAVRKNVANKRSRDEKPRSTSTPDGEFDFFFSVGLGQPRPVSLPDMFYVQWSRRFGRKSMADSMTT